MNPSVGRIVHYVAHGTPVREDGTQAFPCTCRAAIITDLCGLPGGIDPETSTICVSLCVLNPTGQFFTEHVPYQVDEITQQLHGGTWHWPERVE